MLHTSSLAAQSLALNGVVTQPASPPDDISAELMHITPEMARDLLTNALPNRPVSKARVRALIDDLRMGRWQTNGESIILDASLRLLDGQHRLQAVAESGIAITALVAVGVDPGSMPTIDQGARRSAGDALAAAQLPRAKELAAACRWLWRLEHGAMRQVRVPLSNPELAPFVGNHPGLTEALACGRPLRRVVPESLGAALFWHFTRLSASQAREYHTALTRGEGLTAGHPALAVRRRALEERGPLTHAQVVGRAALLVLGWNCMRAQKPCPQGLTWRGERDPAVDFPRLL